MSSLDQVQAVLAEFRDPESGRGLTEMDQVRDVKLDGQRLTLKLALTTFAAPLWDEIRSNWSSQLKAKFPDLTDVQIEIEVLDRPPTPLGQLGVTAKSVIAVGSGKGGVGKSTVATSLAYGLKRAGCAVGLMDADVYGPSVPHLIGVNRRPEVSNNRISPIDADGLKVMSMGFMVPPGEAVVWRGPMLHHAMTNFLRDTVWGPLDYLIIDMPPGTGDVALSLSQLLPLTGSVVVCTPQDVALLDAVKAIAMFKKVNIPVLGMVENMSYFVCPSCDKRYDIFGSGGAKRKSEELGVAFLGEVPINIGIRVRGDEGKTSGNFDDEQCAQYFQSICQNLVRGLTENRRQDPPLPSLSVL